MSTYKYLIIGGGMAGDAAIRGIRQNDETGSICLVSQEEHPPYNRPPLSKSLWFGKSEKTIWRPLDNLNVDVQLNRRIVQLDIAKKRAIDDRGSTYSFEKLLLATGGKVNRFPFGGDDIIYFRTLEDYRRLRDLTESKNRFAIIGGGFIGAEIAAGLANHQKEVMMVFPEAGIGANVFPKEVSDHLTELFRENGVAVHTGQWLNALEKRQDKLVLKTREGLAIEAEGTVAGIGIKPNIEIARQAGLTVNRGIVVNKHLQTSHPDVYAAGDVAEFYNSALGNHVIVEHEENANMTGYFAGAAMTGHHQEYDYLPYFYSSLFAVKYEGVGEMNASLQTVIDWKEPFQEGVIYYLKGKRVRGVVCWNIRKKLNAARKLIAEPGPFEAADLMGKI